MDFLKFQSKINKSVEVFRNKLKDIFSDGESSRQSYQDRRYDTNVSRKYNDNLD